MGSVPRSERSPGEGNGYLLQYSCLENSTDRGSPWQHKGSDTTKQHFHFFHIIYTHYIYLYIYLFREREMGGEKASGYIICLVLYEQREDNF